MFIKEQVPSLVPGELMAFLYIAVQCSIGCFYGIANGFRAEGSL